MKIDDIDKKLIALLKQDSRATNTALAKQIGLTEGAVRHRIDQLVKNSVIKRFTIDASSESVFFAIVMIKAKDDVKKMMHGIAALHAATDAFELSGDFDCCLIIEGESIDAIDSQIDKLRKLKNVRDTKTYVVLRRW